MRLEVTEETEQADGLWYQVAYTGELEDAIRESGVPQPEPEAEIIPDGLTETEMAETLADEQKEAPEDAAGGTGRGDGSRADGNAGDRDGTRRNGTGGAGRGNGSADGAGRNPGLRKGGLYRPVRGRTGNAGLGG